MEMEQIPLPEMDTAAPAAAEDDSIHFWACLGVGLPQSSSPFPFPPPSLFPAHHQPPPPLPLPASPISPSSPPQQPQPVADVGLGLAAPCPDPFLGMEFDSADAAKVFYIAYASRVGFSVRVARSRRSKSGGSDVIMLRLVCSREGFSKEKPPQQQHSRPRRGECSIRQGCGAMLEVVRRGDRRWVASKLVKEHSHGVGLPSRVHYVSTDGDGDLEPFAGMEFESVDAAKTFYYVYAGRLGFEARVRQSRRSSQDESLRMVKLVCSKHRYHSGRMSTPVREDDNGSRLGCEALFEIVRKDGDIWMVSKVVLEHNHELVVALPNKVRCVRSQGDVLVISRSLDETRRLLLNGHNLSVAKEIRYNDLGAEEVECLLQYFKEAQAEDSGFFYAIEFDKLNQMTNIFWADAKARMAYYHYGDAVRLVSLYKNNKDYIPIVLFHGVNNNVQPVVLGCALLVDESEEALCWLFENWLRAMPAKPPISLMTELNELMMIAVSKVMPDTRHVFCLQSVINSVREELPEIFADATGFESGLRKCIEDHLLVESFETCWESMIIKHGLRDNTHMQSLYEMRHMWVPAFIRNTFLAEVSPSSHAGKQNDNVLRKCFTVKIGMLAAIRELEQAISGSYEKEAQADFITMFEKPNLKTASPIEKQAANIYTKAVFEIFQEEFVQSFGNHADRVEEGKIIKYRLFGNEGDKEACNSSLCH